MIKHYSCYTYVNNEVNFFELDVFYSLDLIWLSFVELGVIFERNILFQ